MKQAVALLVLGGALMVTGCTKPGPGGDASIEGSAKHHSTLIPNTKVYIKYDAEEFPGSDLSVYDDMVEADHEAFFKFTGLEKGNYYLFGVGFDSAGPYPVEGGIPVTLSKAETKIVALAITED